MEFKKTILILCLLLFVKAVSLGGDGWVSLFDGESLDGWTKQGGGAAYEVREGAIVGTNGPWHNTFLCTNQTYGDFELELDVFLQDDLNSGIQIRSNVRDQKYFGKTVKMVYGPQVEIELAPGEAGYLYGEQAGGWMTPKADLVKHSVFKNGQWNHYRIVARGPRIQTWVNGRQISDLVDDEIYKHHKQGFIGLQVHATLSKAGTKEVRWKNIRIRETETEGWLPLFNGKDLNGWIPKIKGYRAGENPGRIFRVENGVIKVCFDAFEKFDNRFGHLFFAQPFSRYKFRMEYRFVGEQAPGGPKWAYRNSGVMIHGQSADSMALDQNFPTSIEVQLLGADEGKPRSTGNLCTPGTKYVKDGQLIEAHCVDADSASYPGDQWVQLEIHVDGANEIVHLINGHEVMRYQQPQLDDGTALRKGTISLQAESHGCEFRYIEIKPYDREDQTDN